MIDSRTPVRIFIGSGQASVLPCKTLVYSLRRHSRRALDLSVFNGTHNAIERDGEAPVYAPLSLRLKYRQNTEFSLYRYLIPELCHRQGRAIYLDSDMICRTEIGELFDAPLGDYDFLAAPGVTGTGSWAPSVMVINCERACFDLERIFDDVDRGYYNSHDFARFTPNFRRRHPYHIGALDPRWNEFDRYDAETKIVHYTELMTQPWRVPNHPFGDLWFEYFAAAVEDQTIRQDEIVRSIKLGYARPDILEGNWPRRRRWRRRLKALARRVARRVGTRGVAR